MLVSNIRRNNLSKKASSFRKCYSNFWKERGEKLMTCHLFLDNFLRFLWPLGCFQRFRSFETEFSFKKTQISQFWYHEMFVFLNFVFRKRRFIAETWLCFRACNSRIVTYDQEFCLVVWLMCFNHLLRNLFEKFSFKKSWCCRKHVFVFEIVSLKDLNKFDQIIFFPVTFWVKDFRLSLWKSMEAFPF